MNTAKLEVVLRDLNELEAMWPFEENEDNADEHYDKIMAFREKNWELARKHELELDFRHFALALKKLTENND